MDYLDYVIYVLAVWNFVVFILYGIDKRKAYEKKWRIPEKTLILTAFLMGGIGAWTGMNIFRHKTKHTKFKILIPFAILFNIAAVIGFYYIYKKMIEGIL